MKVLMTADTVGGVWTYALELARALEPHSVQIVLATMGRPLNASQWQEARVACNVQVFESQYALEWMDDPWEDVRRAGDWLLGLEARLEPDVVHLNGYAHGALSWHAPTLMVGHSCVLSWWRAVKDEDAPPAWNRYRQAVTGGLRAASLIAAPSQAMADALQAHYGPLPPIQVIFNSRFPELFPPGPKEKFVLSAGRLWDEGKNMGALARVAPCLPWPVCVAGEQTAPEGGRIEAEGVSLLGQLSPTVLADLLARASIYALPARYEPFGLSALEAGLAGCALVLGDIPSLREVWGDAALFAAPDDCEALEGMLCRLMADAPLRQTMAARARARALEYAPTRMAAEYLAVYQALINPPTGDKTCGS